MLTWLSFIFHIKHFYGIDMNRKIEHHYSLLLFNTVLKSRQVGYHLSKNLWLTITHNCRPIIFTPNLIDTILILTTCNYFI